MAVWNSGLKHNIFSSRNIKNSSCWKLGNNPERTIDSESECMIYVLGVRITPACFLSIINNSPLLVGPIMSLPKRYGLALSIRCTRHIQYFICLRIDELFILVLEELKPLAVSGPNLKITRKALILLISSTSTFIFNAPRHLRVPDRIDCFRICIENPFLSIFPVCFIYY